MPANRITAILRAIADYRVEACFLAALVFTLGHNAFHERAVGIRTTRTHETVVREVLPVRVAEARRARHAEHPDIVRIAVPGRRVHAVGAAGEGKIVIKRESTAATSCAGPALAAAGVATAPTCKVIRVSPVIPGVAVPKEVASGG